MEPYYMRDEIKGECMTFCMHDIPSELLCIKECSRLQCMHGCLHYRRNPLCPPQGHDVVEMKSMVKRYRSARVCYSAGESASRDEVLTLRREFHKRLLNQENELRLTGSYYAMAFTSGACSQCSGAECQQVSCNRPAYGRIPLCATGIDLEHLTRDVLKLPVERLVQYWRYHISSEYIGGGDKGFFFLGVVLY